MIDKNLYHTILRLMPIICVDCVIENDDSVLLVKRKDEPAKNKWWIVGGRLFKNESFENCAIRKCKEEVDLDVEIIRQLIVINEIFDTGPDCIPVHTVGIIYHVKSKSRNVVTDSTISDYKWIHKNSSLINFAPYVQQSLKSIR